MNPLNWSATTNTKQDQNSMRTENLPTEKTFFNIYALFYEKTKDVQMLDGHIAKNNYEHENMVAAAVITDTHETSEWTRFELDFNYEHYRENNRSPKIGKRRIQRQHCPIGKQGR